MKKKIFFIVLFTNCLCSYSNFIHCFLENLFSTATTQETTTQSESNMLSRPIIINNNNTHTNNQSTTLFGTEFLKSEHFRKVSQEVKIKFDNLYQYVANKKAALLKATVAGSYLSLQALLIYLRSSINKINNWSSWREHIPLEELYVMPQNMLAEQLIHDIQKVYINIKNPTDFVTPLMSFIKSVEKEQSKLTLYRNIVYTLNKCYMNKLFFCNQPFYESTDQKIRRLDFIHRSFLGWLTDFKVTNSLSPSARRKVINHLLRSYN